MKKSKRKRKFFVIFVVVIVLLLFLGILLFGIGSNKKTSNNEEIRVIPLDASEIQKVVQAVNSEEIIKELPSSGVIGLRFYSFDEQGRVWRDGFLIGKNGLLKEGEPEIFVAIHSKYINELQENSLCDVLGEADHNGDFSYELLENKVKLGIKYAGMLKYKKCFD